MKSLLIASSFLIMLSQALAQLPETKPSRTRVLIVGISTFQDSTLQPFRSARRDAEEYAAFLQSLPGGGLARDQIRLLTDQQATLASFFAALDWLLEKNSGPVTRLLYIASTAQIIKPLRKPEDVLILFHDSPAAPLQGNTFALRELRTLLENTASKTAAPFSLILSFKSPYEKGNNFATDWNKNGKHRKSAYLKWRSRSSTDTLTAAPSNSTHRQSISNDFIAGLLGLADRDGNMEVNGKEIFWYLKEQPPGFSEPDEFFYMAVSDRKSNISKVDERILADLQQYGTDALFPPMVQLESAPLEEQVLQHAAVGVRKLYEDFILSIKVKNFLTPPERNAVTFYDSLRLVPELEPITGYLRRRLAAAMLDETQQALNAYIGTSANELARRKKNNEQYSLFAKMLGKSSDLLGEYHFMHNTLEAKRLYFEGLYFRLSFINSKDKDSTLLWKALEKQQMALESEPEAAYIFNELGVVYSNLMDTVEARKQYLSAIEFSPTWSIPFVNLCWLSLKTDNWEAAENYGFQAVVLAPKNPNAYAALGSVCLSKENWEAAEDMFKRGIAHGSDLSEAYYNLACLFALKGDKASAFDWLEKAFAQGFDDTSLLETDPDLAAIRADARFVKFTLRISSDSKAVKKD